MTIKDKIDESKAIIKSMQEDAKRYKKKIKELQKEIEMYQNWLKTNEFCIKQEKEIIKKWSDMYDK